MCFHLIVNGKAFADVAMFGSVSVVEKAEGEITNHDAHNNSGGIGIELLCLQKRIQTSDGRFE